MELGITEDAQREGKMSTLSIFPLLKVMNLLIILNIFEGAQGAQHAHWGAGVSTFSGVSQAPRFATYWDQSATRMTPYERTPLPISATCTLTTAISRGPDDNLGNVFP